MLAASAIGAATSLIVSLVALWYAQGATRSSLASAEQVARSGPTQQREAVQGLHEAVVAIRRDMDSRNLDFDARIDAQQTKLVAWRTDIEGLLEAVEDTLERVERKRRSASAAASRANRNGGAEAEFDPTNLEHLKAVARQRGHDVL